MIESNLSLARAVARRYAGRGADLDDLVQVGAVGLIKAADGFDPTRGVAFTTFATRTIEGEIRHHLRDQTSSLRIPRELQRMSGNLARCRAELAASLSRSPTVSELADTLNADEGEVERALVAERARDLISISSEDPTGEPATGAEPSALSDDRLLLASSVRTLDERERRIVYLRFHADLTEREIAQEVGISQAHVSRLLAGALAKLRNELARAADAESQPDITINTAISPESGAVSTPARAGEGGPPAANSPGGRGAGDKIEAVGAPKVVAKQLELPYQVAVTAQRDGEQVWWSATVEGLPDCSARGATPEEAVKQLRPLMESWLATAFAEARGGPTAPTVDAAKRKPPSSHSGRFLVRMPSTLHEQLAQAAERKNVSLNRYVTDALAASVAPEPSPPSQDQVSGAEAQETRNRRPSGRTVRIALAANLVVVVFAGVIAAVLLVVALQRGI